jgi:hypothetical protein
MPINAMIIYPVVYTGVALSLAVLLFERRDL